MRIRWLDWNEFAALYATAMAADFPPAERKPLPLLRRLWNAGVCSACEWVDESGARRAYAVLQRPAGASVWLLDYLAVDASARGQGIGGQVLAALRQTPDAAALLLEIERVERAETPAQAEERIRRRRFYLKNGAIPTGVFTRADGGVEYEILCLPVTGAAVDAAAGMQSIYETLFVPGEYAVWTE